MAGEPIPKIPNLDLAQHKFILQSGPKDAQTDAKNKLWKEIQDKNMAPYYIHICEDLKIPVDQALLSRMQKANTDELANLDDKIEDAEKNLGETELSDALIKKAEYYTEIGDKEKALSAYRIAFEKTPTLGHRIDIIFSMMRIGFFFTDNDEISRQIEKAKSLIEEGGDWDRRNRLKVYEGLYRLTIRDFSTAATLLLDTLSTFTSVELMEYKDFVKYAVLAALISLKRPDIKKKVLDAPEILEVIHEIPNLEDYMRSLYECKYSKFFESLAAIEPTLRNDRYFNAHYRFYVREMRIIAYAQLLESYRSLTIDSMAQSFGVTNDFIDSDLSKFIAAGRLNCVIDKVNGIVETNRPDAKNHQYQVVIKQGDLLLNRIQNLSRIINV
ncbi:26S proteasome subunit RPN7-domain-containing protein [Paraphysoderma sedebokerense]|nr:26S proteasome subunit RPN7-domain-containing protein [Paraphysoderma sedebokerense]